MKGENALVKESTKICNQIKRSGKKYQNTELYEQCKNIQKILDKYSELKDHLCRFMYIINTQFPHCLNACHLKTC